MHVFGPREEGKAVDGISAAAQDICGFACGRLRAGLRLREQLLRSGKQHLQRLPLRVQ